MNVADLTRLHVMAYFDEPDVGKLNVGQPVKIVWDAKPERAWHGRILQVPTTIITYGTRNVGECLISIDDANGDLLPNTNVTVTVTTQEKDHVLSIPREGLHTDGLSDYVYKVTNGRLHRTAVKVGVVSMVQVEIAGGLSEGDTVALSATSEVELRDGLEVKAQP
jgi:HlyD family secretion protein